MSLAFGIVAMQVDQGITRVRCIRNSGHFIDLVGAKHSTGQSLPTSMSRYHRSEYAQLVVRAALPFVPHDTPVKITRNIPSWPPSFQSLPFGSPDQKVRCHGPSP